MIKRLLIILNFTFFSTLLFAQVHKGFQWISPDHKLYNIDLSSGILYQTAAKKSKLEVGKIQNWELIKSELPGDFGVNAFYKADSIIITIPGTGQLYSFNLNELILKRLDQTYFRGYNFNANQFFRNDTLFSIGGEGFWTKHSLITYYNPSVSEWGYYKSLKNNKHIVTNKFSGYSKKYDSFFSAYLTTDRVLTNKNTPLMIYSFKKDLWENKGFLSEKLTRYAHSDYRFIWTGEYFILLYDISESVIFIADPFENKLYEHTSINDQFYLKNNELYSKNKYIYSRSIASTGKLEKVYFDSISVNNLLHRSKFIGPVYEKKQFDYQNPISISIGFIALAIGIIFYRKRKSNSQEFKLTKLELMVIEKLLNEKNNNKISSAELNSLLKISDKSYDNQRQIRFRVIGSINQKLQAELNLKDLIFRSSNNEDKRMMDYFINPDIKTKDLEKLTKILQKENIKTEV